VLICHNTISTNGKERHTFSTMVERKERRPKRRWVNDIKMDLREIGWGGVD
jgi:hypothetical protein